MNQKNPSLIDPVKPDGAKIFMPKPFVFAQTPLGDRVKVYLPGRSLYVAGPNEFTLKKSTLCLCVHMCDQFFAYSTTDAGIRIVPPYATCKFGGLCDASRLLINGKQSGKSIKPDSRYICRTNPLLNGLDKQEKTR